MSVGPILTYGALNLRDPAGWYVGEGVDLGRRAITKKWLSQDGVDGAELASSWAGIVTMTIPLILTPQASAAAMETLVNSLNTELDKLTNLLTYLPHGITTGLTYLIDTYRSDKITLLDGQGGRSPWVNSRNGKLIVVQIDRAPDMRSRGTII